MTTKVKYIGNLRTEATSPNYQEKLHTDVKKIFGGYELHPSPTDLYEVALASCTLSVIGLRANRLNISLEGLRASVDITYSPSHQISKILLTVECSHPIDQRTADALEEAAEHCPVKKVTDPSITIESVFKWNIR
jgi:uncharacterized OsmC-like protein